MPTALGVNTSRFSCPQLWAAPASSDPTRNAHSFPSCLVRPGGSQTSRRPPVTRHGSPGPGRPAPSHATRPSPLLRPQRWTEGGRACWSPEHGTRCSQCSLTHVGSGQAGPCEPVRTPARRPDHNLTAERTSNLKDSDHRGENFLIAKGKRVAISGSELGTFSGSGPLGVM